METRLFKTKKIAEKYIRENYPESEYALSNSYITEDSDYDARDMPNLQRRGYNPIKQEAAITPPLFLSLSLTAQNGKSPVCCTG